MALFYGCGPREVGAEATGPSTTHQGTRSCNYTGYCYRCGMGFDGKLSCGFGMSALCSGTQSVVLEQTPIRRRYEDGSSKLDTSARTLQAGPCS
jgi:hypothetical protein